MKFKLILQSIIYFMIGVLFIARPLIKTAILVNVIGFVLVAISLWILFDGIFKVKSFKGKLFRSLEGIMVGILGYVFFISNPLIGAAILVYIAVWSLIIMAITNTAYIFKVKSKFKWIAIILNVFVVYFGVLALFDPQLASVIFIWTIGFQLFSTSLSRLFHAFSISSSTDAYLIE